MNSETPGGNRYHKLQQGVLRRMGEIGPFVEGTLCQYVRPGRKSPSWHLTYKTKGKTRTVYVPVAMVKEVREWTRQYRHLKRLIRKQTSHSLAIIHGFAASRRAASRKR